MEIEYTEYQVIGKNIEKNTLKLCDIETGDTFHWTVPFPEAAYFIRLGRMIQLLPKLSHGEMFKFLHTELGLRMLQNLYGGPDENVDYEAEAA